jgi:ABC-2 type transport system ATP-binding protein
VSTCVLEATNLAKRFGRKWALRDCTLSIPRGRVAALVGPNGAGKSTLLRLAVGLSRPSAGSIDVLGETPGIENAALLGRVGYLDQERPLYRGFRVDEMFRFGQATNPTWDMGTAHAYVDQLGISLRDRVDQLSGGQRAQVALTMSLAKNPELLILDEPAAALDPLAREDLLRLLMRQVAERGTSVVLSTHALGDVASICDYLVILSHARVVLADDLEFVVESHRLISSSTSGSRSLPEGVTVIDTHTSSRDVTHLARVTQPLSDQSWQITEPTLDEIIMAYLRHGTGSTGPAIDGSVSTEQRGLS